MEKEITFCALRTKEVINLTDGRRLGRICDLVIEVCTGKIIGIVAPGSRRTFFKPCDDIFIPWCEIDRIGDDVILVCLGRAREKGKEHKDGCRCDDCLRLSADLICRPRGDDKRDRDNKDGKCRDRSRCDCKYCVELRRAGCLSEGKDSQDLAKAYEGYYNKYDKEKQSPSRYDDRGR